MNKGKFFKFKIKNIRNKTEYIEGYISEVYDRIFIVKSSSGSSVSFSYTDILSGMVEIEGLI